MKNSLFDSLFLVNLSVFCGISLFFLKVPRMAIYIVKMGGFGMAPRRCGIHSKSQSLMQKTYFLVLLKPYLQARTLVCVRMLLGCVRRLRVSFGLYFPKIDF